MCIGSFVHTERVPSRGGEQRHGRATKVIEQPLESHVESPFAERLVELGLWLVEHDPLWRERPFTGLPVAWEAEHKEVAAALRSLSNEVIEVFETRPEDLPQMPAAYRQWAAAARRFSARPQLRRGPAFSDERLPQHVKGRKWQQVVAFVRTVLDHRPPSVSRWVDWCSGKGHLGRTLAEVSGLPLTCVERQRPLCRDGLELLGPSVSEVRFVEADVLAGDRQAELDDLFGPGVGGVALHACGQLHRELLTRATARGAEFLALAPCCHHATPIDPFCPLSTVARKIPLRLGNHQLRLIGLHEAVAGPRRLILRRREQAWRLGLDLILREATGEDRYRPLGSVPRSWMRSSCQ